MKKKAIIISIKGFTLSRKEKFLLTKESPWGLILFKRNIKSIIQLKILIKNIQKLTKEKNFPILIDEEGGTVTRLNNIINHDFSANYFGNLYSINEQVCINLYINYLNSLCKLLKYLGLNINTIPVLDVLRKNTNKIIGKRSFSSNKKIIKKLGSITVDQCHKNKIITVIKHIPGHGATTLDSHIKIPKINLSLKKLNDKDFFPF